MVNMAAADLAPRIVVDEKSVLWKASPLTALWSSWNWGACG